MSEPEMQWLKASEVINLMTDQYGNRHDVKAWLADALRDGTLSARAAATWLSDKPKISFKLPEDAEALQTDLIVPERYWRASKKWSEDQQDWRWPVNQAIVTVRRKPLKRRYFRGLQFLQADVDRLQKKRGVKSDAKSRGPETAAAKWGVVAAKLQVLIERNELAGVEKPSGNALANKLAILTNDVFEKTSLGDFSRAFLDNHMAKK